MIDGSGNELGWKRAWFIGPRHIEAQSMKRIKREYFDSHPPQHKFQTDIPG